jgi:outer membrane protein TolC
VTVFAPGNRRSTARVTYRGNLHLWKEMPSGSRVTTAIVAAAFGLAASVASAQELLTVDRAVQDALAYNASLRAARAAVSEGDALVSEARSGWFPRVSVTETWQRGDEPVFVFSSLLSSRQFAATNFAIDSLNHPDATGFFRNRIGVEQLIFDGGRQQSVTASAESRRDMTQLSADEASAALVTATVEVYGRTLVAEAGERAAQAALDAAREDLTRAQNRRETGLATDADVLALVAHVADLQQRAIHYQGEAAVSRAELNRLMGVPIAREYRVAPPADAEDPSLATASVDALLAEADRSRPELRRVAVAQQLADADRKNVRAGLIPQVAAQAAFDFSGTQFSNRASAWLVGAEFRWNLSLGGAETARLRAATDARTRAAAEAEDARAAVHVEVVTALRRLQAANARRSAGRAAVEQARESQRITRDRFEAGIAGVTDVLRASSAVVEAESQRMSAAVDAVASEAMLRRALGRYPPTRPL